MMKRETKSFFFITEIPSNHFCASLKQTTDKEKFALQKHRIKQINIRSKNFPLNSN